MTTTSLALPRRRSAAFTLVEMLLVIGVISILASLVISSFSDAAQTSRDVVARQQQAVWQSALNNWVDGKLGRVDTTISSDGAAIGIEVLTAHYNSLTTAARVALIYSYLDGASVAHFTEFSTGGVIRSNSMQQTGKYLQLPTWGAGTYPHVDLLP